MRQTGTFLLASMAVMMLLKGQPTIAQETPVSARVIDYFGYAGCILLENQNTRVVLCPAVGGRVLEYSWKGKNSLYLDPSQKSWTPQEGQPPVDPCGGRFDIGPERVIPRRPALWLGKWSGEIVGPNTARLTSVEDEATGTQLVREFTLDSSSSKLTCKQTIKNTSDQPTEWCHWSRTLAQGGGICLIPLTKNSRFPKQYVMYGPGPVIDYQPEDPNIRVRDGFLEVLSTPVRPKLGMDSYAGWFCYLMKNDLMFVKRYPTYPDRVYNEVAGLTISIWYFKDLMCELEPIGPREKLAPGESASFTEEWWLLPYRYPEKATEVDLKNVSQVVEQHAR